VGIGAHGAESGIRLNAVELDYVFAPDERQDAYLRVPFWRARDQRAMAHLRHESVRGLLVGWVVGAGEHPTSVGEPPRGLPTVR